MKPITETYEYRTKTHPENGDVFTHIELQTVREYQAPDGVRFAEPVFDEEDMEDDEPSGLSCSHPMVAMFGRLEVGGVVHIADFDTPEHARQMLKHLGVCIQP